MIIVPLWLGRALRRLVRMPVLRRFVRIDKSGRPLTQDYWRQSLDAELPVRLDFCFLWPKYRPFFKFGYVRDIGENYLTRSHDALLNGLDEMQKAGVIPRITADSVLFEAGCNVGAVMRDIQRRYGCRVVGLDISETAIAYARSHVFKGNERAEFMVGDARDSQVLADVPDARFTHVLSVAHLAHLPNGPAKTAYIESLKRVGKCVVLEERFASDNDPMSRNRGFTDFETEHGFTLFKKTRKAHPRYDKYVGLFFYTHGQADFQAQIRIESSAHE